MKFSLLFSFLTFYSIFVIAQSPTIAWQKTLGGVGVDDVHIVLEKPDNSGYYIIGSTSSPAGFELTQGTHGNVDAWVICFNNFNQIEWEKVYGGTESDGLVTKAIIHNDKLFVVASSNSGISGNKTLDSFGSTDIWLLCLDLGGNILWQQAYGGTEGDVGEIMVIRDGILYVLGHSTSGISGNKSTPNIGERDFWLLKIDPSDGEKLDERTFGSELTDTPYAMSFDEDGNIYLFGSSDTGISGDKTIEGFGGKDLWLLKLNSNLEIINQACFGTSADEGTSGMIWYENNLYIASSASIGNNGSVGQTVLGTRDTWAFCLNEDLEIVWSYLYGGSDYDRTTEITIWDGKLALLGSSTSTASGIKQSPFYGGSGDYWLLFLDRETGGFIHEESYGGSGMEIATAITSLTNNNLIIAGISDSGISGLKTEPYRGGSSDIWILELNASALLSVYEFDATSILIYPNPSSDVVYFQVPQELLNGHLELYSMDGKLIKSVFINEINFRLDLTDISGSQMLMFKYTHAHGISSGKISKI
jgi:hypothetical protein